VEYGDWLVGGCLFVLFVWLFDLLAPLSAAAGMVEEERRVVRGDGGGRLCAADEDVVEGDVDW
jgi:hypothetical protein